MYQRKRLRQDYNRSDRRSDEPRERIRRKRARIHQKSREREWKSPIVKFFTETEKEALTGAAGY